MKSIFKQTRHIKFSLISLISLIAATVMLLTVPVGAAAFSDMPERTHWSYTPLLYAVNMKLLQGADGKIMPKDELTRAQMATILVRAYNATAKASLAEYTDVDSGKWYYDYLAVAVKMGIFLGDGSGKLRPDDFITRQEVFVVLARATGKSGGNTAVLNDFTDANSIASWAKSAVVTLVSEGFVKGADGKINPSSPITRAEFAQIIYNLVNGGAISLEASASTNVSETTAAATTAVTTAPITTPVTTAPITYPIPTQPVTVPGSIITPPVTTTIPPVTSTVPPVTSQNPNETGINQGSGSI